MVARKLGWTAVLTFTLVSLTPDGGSQETPLLDRDKSLVSAPVLDPHETITSKAVLKITGRTSLGSTVEVVHPGGVDVFESHGRRFRAVVPLVENVANELFFTAISAQGRRSAPTRTQVVRDAEVPSLFVDFPADRAEVTLAVVDVIGRVGDRLSGFEGLTVVVNGIEAEVDIGIGQNGTWLASGVPLEDPGVPTLIQATATDVLGNSVTEEIEVTQVEIPADRPSMVIDSGNAQIAPVHSVLPQPIVVHVTQADGSDFADKLVTFHITRSDGDLSVDGVSPGASMLQVRTDAQGRAAAFWQVGGDAGCGNNRVGVDSAGIEGTVFFCASASAGAATQIQVGTGNDQRVEVNTIATLPLRVFVSDSTNPVANVPVVFSVLEGGGDFDGSPLVTVLTDATGHCEVPFRVGADAGLNTVEATFSGNPGLTARFHSTGVARDEEQPTRFAGLVLDNAGRPIQGAEVTIHVGETTTPPVFSDLDGKFVVDPVPGDGAAAVRVDGFVATRVGGREGVDVPVGTFPVLEYATVVIPNADNTLPMAVLLPELNPNNVKSYDTTQDVELTVEEIDGLKMIVREGTTVTLVDGTVASPTNPVNLSLNQVHFDEIPMPMPDGAAPPFAWTLQPGGTKFDPPLEVHLPNMSGLPPQSIVYFLSFDHDVHRFDVVASGAISEDGSVAITDPGSGIDKAGWGGNCPPYPNRTTVQGGPTTPGDGIDDLNSEPPRKSKPKARPAPPPSTLPGSHVPSDAFLRDERDLKLARLEFELKEKVQKIRDQLNEAIRGIDEEEREARKTIGDAVDSANIGNRILDKVSFIFGDRTTGEKFSPTELDFDGRRRVVRREFERKILIQGLINDDEREAGRESIQKEFEQKQKRAEERRTEQRKQRVRDAINQRRFGKPPKVEETGVEDLADPIYFFSGEFYLEEEDLRIPGRGFDFIWARKYRSKLDTPTAAMGHGWDFSYNILVFPDGPDMVVCDGNSRSDRMILQPDGSWGRSGFFRRLEQNLDQTFTLTFEDLGRWEFRALDGSSSEGRITEIVDRNGNAMSFQYDGAGRLTTITDTLGRNITVAYDGQDRITTVTDFIGRQVQFDYYGSSDSDGNDGDLRSVTSPSVTGTPTGNDFPLGKTTTYTYSTGFADDRLNHNLLTITDPKGQTWLSNTYSTTQDEVDFDFDRVVSQDWGDAGDRIDLHYVPQTPSNDNLQAVTRVVLNDRVGHVKEMFYDSLNRAVIVREFTGQADADLPTTETDNRPTGKLRLDDPDFFETTFEYNEDFLVQRITHPAGNQTVYFYEGDLDPGAARRNRSNLRLISEIPAGHALPAAQEALTQVFEYDDGPGGSNAVTKYIEPNGNVTTFDRDANGNLLKISRAIDSVVEDLEYNAFGQLTAKVHPDNGSGHRRRDEWTYHSSGVQAGYLATETIDTTAASLTTSFEYDAVGNPIRVVDPLGQDQLSVWNELDQRVRFRSREVGHAGGSPARYEVDFFYDANDNLVRIDRQNVDALGQVDAVNPYLTEIYAYEILNELTRTCVEVGSFDVPRGPNPQLDCGGLPEAEFATVELIYDANRRVILEQFGEAVEGRQPENTIAVVYDERDLLFQRIEAPGDSDQSTTQVDYDDNRNLRAIHQGLEGDIAVERLQYDAFNRLVERIDPMGNRVAMEYDANGNRTRGLIEGELFDVDGSAANTRLSEARWEYDALNRLVRAEIEYFDPETQLPFQGGRELGKSIREWEYSDDSQVTRLINDNLHDRSFAYDTVGRLSQSTDALGNTTVWTYDGNSNVITQTETELSDLGLPPEVFVTTRSYDARDRPVEEVDPVGNTTTSAYDSRDNLVQRVDALGNVTHASYDGRDRLVETRRLLTDDGTGGGTVVDEIVTVYVWDDSDRRTLSIDGEAHATQFEYDGLDRLVRRVEADGTERTWSYDVRHNPILRVDANGTQVATTFDRGDRVRVRTVAVASGVSSDTTFEQFEWDGLGRLKLGTDDDSAVEFEYDSMSNVRTETLDGAITRSEYDGLGNRTRCVYPGGRELLASYDDLERVSTITEGPDTVATYAYRGPERIERIDLENGTRGDFFYDGVVNDPGDNGVRRMVGVEWVADPDGSATVLDDRRYAWTATGHKSQRVDERAGGPELDHSFEYDSAYRLVRTVVVDGVATPVRDESYTLDLEGNRATVTGGLRPGAYVLEPTQDAPVHQYTETSFEVRQYDDNGNLTLIDSGLSTERRATYDAWNRLVEYEDTATGQAGTYRYDVLGRRLERTVDDGITTTTTRYLYDRDVVCEERDDQGTTVATYVWSGPGGRILTMRRAGADLYYHAEDQHHIIAVSDDTGAVVERYDYQDYGEPAIFDPGGAVRSQSAIGNAYLTHSWLYDAESGWLVTGGPTFDPIAGRYVGPDSPVGVVGPRTRYADDDPWSR